MATVHPRILCFEGEPGCGKTRGIGEMRDLLVEHGYPVCEIVEPDSWNPFIEKFYEEAQNPESARLAALQLQTMVLAHYIESSRKIADFLRENQAGVVLHERAPISQNLVFLETNKETLGEKNAKALRRLVNSTLLHAPMSCFNTNNPDMQIVYIDVSLDECMARIEKRGRPGEAGRITRAYMARICDHYQKVRDLDQSFVVSGDHVTSENLALRIYDHFFPLISLGKP